jgi:hypothetical protein
MGYRCRELDVPHALAANRRACNLDTALVTNDTLITDVFIFTTVTLPIPRRAKNGLTEKPIFFGAQASVVNGFRFKDFSVRPTLDRLR